MTASGESAPLRRAGLVLILPMLIVVLWLIGAPGEKHDNRFGPVTTKD
jgi:hypothetical protein